MSNTTAAMQGIIDRLDSAENWASITSAVMALARHVDARLTALEANPLTPNPYVDWKAFAVKATAENERLTAEVKAWRDAESVRTDERNQARTQYKSLCESYSNFNRGLSDRTTQRDEPAAQVDALTMEIKRKHDANLYLDSSIRDLQTQLAEASRERKEILATQGATLGREIDVLRLHLDSLAAEVVDRTTERDAAWERIEVVTAERDDFKVGYAKLYGKEKELEGVIESLKVQRNALAAEVDDLRNVNAGLRKNNERMADDALVLAADVTHWRKRYQALQSEAK